MKNLMLVLFVMLTTAITTDLQAQTKVTCTPAQKEACKKICGTSATCTPEQMAACKKVCDKTAASTAAVKVVNQAPEKAPSCKKANATASTNDAAATPVKLVGLELVKEEKKTSCKKTCDKKVVSNQ